MALTNAQYDAILREYQQRQLRNHQIIMQREEELYLHVPALSDLDDETSRISVESAEKLLAGDEDAVATLKDQLQALKAKRIALMAEAGYPEDYLVPPYDCPDCQDTGFIEGKKCHCLIQASIDLVYAQSHLDDILERENFEHFSFAYYSDDLIDEKTQTSSLEYAHIAFDSAQNFVQHFGENGGNLLLYGDIGTGKTFLSNCIAKDLLDRGFSVIYFTAFQLFDIFEKEVFHKDSDAIEMHQQIFSCDLLIIDDLGTEFANSFTTSQLFLCLNERLLHNKSTVISTNLSMKQIRDLYSERTSSRIISSYTPIKFFGNDIRIEKKLTHK
jgi:DNA replication protein DnaC